MPQENLLEELKLQFERFIQHKERLDTKTNNIIVMAGAIFTLFMGFGVFLLSGIESNQPALVNSAFVLLIIGIILFVLSILYSIEAYRLRNYYYPLGYNAFYNENGLNHDVISQFNNATVEEFNQHFIAEYLESIKQNQQSVLEIAKNLDRALLFFVGLVLLIPIFSIVIIAIKLIQG